MKPVKSMSLVLLAMALTCSMSAQAAQAAQAPASAPVVDEPSQATQMQQALQEALQDERIAHKKDTEALQKALQKAHADVEMCRAGVGKAKAPSPPK